MPGQWSAESCRIGAAVLRASGDPRDGLATCCRDSNAGNGAGAGWPMDPVAVPCGR